MTAWDRCAIDDEPERYELQARALHQFELGRREFLAAAGGGVLILLLAPALRGTAADPALADSAAAEEIGAWLHIDEQGRIHVFTGKAEVGQDIRTSLAQSVADDLRVPLDRVQLVMADTDRVPFDQGTFGSRSTPAMAPQLRRAAAAARAQLAQLGATRWGIEATQVEVAGGVVTNQTTGESLQVGELTRGQRFTQELRGDVPITPAAEWTVAGTSPRKVNGLALVTGAHRFASDQQLPGMLHGKVLRPPAFGASLVSAELDAARGVDGTVVVRDGGFVGVAAPTGALAERALAAVQATWKPAPQPAGAELERLLRTEGAPARGGRGRGRDHRSGSIEVGMAAADVKLTATYTCAYLAHAPLEPRAALATWENDKLTVWTGTQRPFGVRRELAEAFRIPEARVRVIVPDTGSGYGGKHTGDAAIEAARLAREAKRPVKVVWTREEEFTWAYFRPAAVIDIRAGATRDGKLCAWEFHNFNSGASGIRTPYEVEHQTIQFHGAESPLRQGSYRALAATANHFARESMLDELAHALGMDPLALRRQNLRDERMLAVLAAAAERFGWNRRADGAGRGHGLACGFEKGGYVATCAEVQLDDDGSVRVVRTVTAFECGALVHPDNTRNQVEGAVVMGLGGALFEGIRFDAGRILNPRFSGYRVPRFSDVPDLEVVLLDRKDLPSAGAGETPIVAIAPAVANAIFAASGKRLHAMPLVPQGLK